MFPNFSDSRGSIRLRALLRSAALFYHVPHANFEGSRVVFWSVILQKNTTEILWTGRVKIDRRKCWTFGAQRCRRSSAPVILSAAVILSAPVILSAAKDLRSSSQLPETKPTAVILRAVYPERSERAQDDSANDIL